MRDSPDAGLNPWPEHSESGLWQLGQRGSSAAIPTILPLSRDDTDGSPGQDRFRPYLGSRDPLPDSWGDPLPFTSFAQEDDPLWPEMLLKQHGEHLGFNIEREVQAGNDGSHGLGKSLDQRMVEAVVQCCP